MAVAEDVLRQLPVMLCICAQSVRHPQRHLVRRSRHTRVARRHGWLDEDLLVVPGPIRRAQHANDRARQQLERATFAHRRYRGRLEGGTPSIHDTEQPVRFATLDGLFVQAERIELQSVLFDDRLDDTGDARLQSGDRAVDVQAMVHDDLCQLWERVGLHASVNDVRCLGGTCERRIEAVRLREVLFERVQRLVRVTRMGDEGTEVVGEGRVMGCTTLQEVVVDAGAV